jgi:hypothetical protein
MPNGVEQNIMRLAMACASFRGLHGSWPTEARVSPVVMWDFGQVLDAENFEILCSRLRLRTTKHAQIAVGTPKAHLVYEGTDHDFKPGMIDEAWTWLGVRIRYGDHE